MTPKNFFRNKFKNKMDTTKEKLTKSGDKSGLFQLNDAEMRYFRKKLLDICIDIFDFCEHHNLCCMLGGGTLLGAVRHNGFIPWDDDMDLLMPRKDYDTFIKLFTKYKGNQYDIYVPDLEHLSVCLSMKVSLKNTIMEDIFTAGNPVKTGVSIDVFPIEHAPSNHILRYLKGYLSNIFSYSIVSAYIFQNRSSAIKQIYSGTIQTRINYSIRCLLGLLLSFKNYNWWYRQYDHFIQSPKESDFCTIPTGRGHYLGELHRKNVFYPCKKYNFENFQLWGPANADQYLTSLYGNYRELPPVEKRETHFYTRIKI